MLRRRLDKTYISSLEVMAMIPQTVQSPQYQEQQTRRETRIRIETSLVQFSSGQFISSREAMPESQTRCAKTLVSLSIETRTLNTQSRSQIKDTRLTPYAYLLSPRERIQACQVNGILTVHGRGGPPLA
jgi:hypothetical protein